MSVTADSMSQDLKRERERHMTADCKQLNKICALHRHHADQLHHKHKYVAPTSVEWKEQEAATPTDEPRHPGAFFFLF